MNMSKKQSEKKPPALCPFCEMTVETPLIKSTKHIVNMYYCPHCNKILGFTNRL